MDQNPRELYLEAQVTTATPQKLRLMLIEAAQRFARQTLRHWEQQEDEQALEAMIRCRTILAELLASIEAESSPLAKRVAAVYAFLYQHLTTAGAQRDAKRVREVIEVLEVDRETWWLLCEQMPAAPPRFDDDVPPRHREIIAPHVTNLDGTRLGGNVSLEA